MSKIVLNHSGQSIHIPLIIGDMAFAVRRVGTTYVVMPGKVKEVFFSEKMELCYRLHRVARGIFGERIFKSKQAAEDKALELNSKVN